MHTRPAAKGKAKPRIPKTPLLSLPIARTLAMHRNMNKIVLERYKWNLNLEYKIRFILQGIRFREFVVKFTKLPENSWWFFPVVPCRGFWWFPCPYVIHKLPIQPLRNIPRSASDAKSVKGNRSFCSREFLEVLVNFRRSRKSLYIPVLQLSLVRKTFHSFHWAHSWIIGLWLGDVWEVCPGHCHCLWFELKIIAQHLWHFLIMQQISDILLP